MLLIKNKTCLHTDNIMGTDPPHSIFHFCRVHWEVRGKTLGTQETFLLLHGLVLPVRIALVLQVSGILKAPLLVEFRFCVQQGLLGSLCSEKYTKLGAVSLNNRGQDTLRPPWHIPVLDQPLNKLERCLVWLSVTENTTREHLVEPGWKQQGLVYWLLASLLLCREGLAFASLAKKVVWRKGLHCWPGEFYCKMWCVLMFYRVLPISYPKQTANWKDCSGDSAFVLESTGESNNF